MIHPARLRAAVWAALLAVWCGCSAAGQKKDEVLLNFTGVLKTLTNNQIVIEPDPDNSMTFVRSKRTKVGKNVQTGNPVRVDCVMRMNGELEAIAVTAIDVDGSLSSDPAGHGAGRARGTATSRRIPRVAAGLRRAS